MNRLMTMMSVSCLVNLDWCLMGLDEFKPIALRNTAVKLLAAAAVFLFVRKPEDLWVYAFVWSLSTLLGCLSCMFSLRGKVTPVKVTWKEALKHLAPCALLSISVIAVSVYRQMDKVMIGALAFLGCPLRMIIRLGGGDLNALVALVGFACGIPLIKWFLRLRKQPQPAAKDTDSLPRKDEKNGKQENQPQRNDGDLHEQGAGNGQQ